MRKLFSIFAASMMLFAASCSTEKFDEPKGDGNVTFTVQLPGGLQSRALGDGTTATKLYVAAYEANQTAPLAVANGAQSIADMSNLTATVSLQLVTGKTYDLVFWAQAADAPYAFNPTGRTVDMNYSGAAANAENRDAFFHIENGLTVTGPMEKDITLKRPFAQLNFVTADYQAAKDGGIEATKTSVKVKNLKPTLSLVDGTAQGDAAEVTFTTAARPTETMTIGNGSYDYLAMNYLLVDDTRDVVECEMTAYDAADANDTRVLAVSSVPVQRNYRTNIYGALLTSTTNFNVTINPAFDGEHNGESPDFFAIGANGNYYSTISEAIAALDVNGTAEQNVITLGAGEFSLPSSIDRNLTIEAAVQSRSTVYVNAKLKFTGSITASGKDLVFKGVNVEWPVGSYNGILHNKSVTFTDCSFKGTYFCYGNTETFEGCTFEGPTDAYSIWTYGAKNVNVNNCVFNSAGKAILVYNESSSVTNNITISDTEFTASQDLGKAAVEIHSERGTSGTLTITNSTATGFNTAGLWQELNNGTKVATHNFATTVDGKAYYLNGVQAADSEGFYGIDSPVGLQQAARFVFPGRKYKVLADLDMNGINYPYVNVNGGDVFVLNGNGKTIKNLNMADKEVAALISRVAATGIEISNLTIANSTFTGNNVEAVTAVSGLQGCAGAFIGWVECHTMATTGTLTNCVSKNNTIGKAKYAGGLVGYQSAGAITMTDCKAIDCTLSTNYAESGKYKGHLGGLIGLFSSGTITNATATGLTITGATYEGQEANKHMRFGALIGTGYAAGSVAGATVSGTINGTAITAESQLIGNVNGVTFSSITFQ
ncbi:MAG: hypothetical protein PUD91_07840 [Bacteroidales bacterium]|nr:hypothetical protein [Bacteroidales bacterium]